MSELKETPDKKPERNVFLTIHMTPETEDEGQLGCTLHITSREHVGQVPVFIDSIRTNSLGRAVSHATNAVNRFRDALRVNRDREERLMD